MLFCSNSSAEKTYSTEIDSCIYKLYYGRNDDPVPTVDDVYNMINKKQKNMTMAECERYMIICASKIYDSTMFDTNNVDIIQARIISDILWSFDISNRYNDNVEKFLYKLYNSDYSRFIEYSFRMLVKYSKNWFQFSKNVVDSINSKYHEQYSDLYYELNNKLLNSNENVNDSLKFITYYMMTKKWDVVIYLDSIFAIKEPLYANSIQRLDLIKRVDSVKVKANAKNDKKYRNVKFDPDVLKQSYPKLYRVYQMLIKQKGLTNYTPPQIDKKK